MKDERDSRRRSISRLAKAPALAFALLLLSISGPATKTVGQSVPAANAAVPRQQVDEAQKQIALLIATLAQLTAGDARMADQLTRLRSQLAVLDDEQAAILNRSIDLPAFSKSVGRLASAIPRTAGLNTNERLVRASGEHPLDPPNYGLCGMVRTDAGSGIALLTTKAVLDEAVAQADSSCNSIVVAAGFGTTVPQCVVYNVLSIARLAVTSVVESLRNCDDDINGTEIFSTLANTQHLHNDLATSVQNDNANTATIRTDIATSTATINAQIQMSENRVITAVLTRLEKLAEENLRVLIETNLVSESRYTNAQFFLPKSAGGQLETVRTIVEDTIRRQKEAGISGTTIQQAEAALLEGDAAYSKRGWKQAYASYRLAYLRMAILPSIQEP